MMLGLDSSSENSCSRILDFKYLLMLSFVQGSHDGWLGISGRSCPCPLHGLEADLGLCPLHQRKVQGQLESPLAQNCK